jgi:hypothetical protein
MRPEVPRRALRLHFSNLPKQKASFGFLSDPPAPPAVWKYDSRVHEAGGTSNPTQGADVMLHTLHHACLAPYCAGNMFSSLSFPVCKAKLRHPSLKAQVRGAALDTVQQVSTAVVAAA